ncbi:unnamed protein product, partial [Staurois parvus]
MLCDMVRETQYKRWLRTADMLRDMVRDCRHDTRDDQTLWTHYSRQSETETLYTR